MTKLGHNGLERSQFGYTVTKWGQMVLKGVNCVHNNKIRSNGLGRKSIGAHNKNHVKWYQKSQLGAQYKDQVIWS